MKVKYLGKKNSSKVLDYSPNLLDSVKRSQTDATSYYGIDYWNIYEFSYLNSRNKPTLEALEIKIFVDSEFTVESKSLKIYLASFYKRKFKNSINAYTLIERDLSKLTKSKVNFHDLLPNLPKFRFFSSVFVSHNSQALCPDQSGLPR